MIDYAFDIIDGIVACFTMNLSWDYLVTTYWFLIFIEFPRYYLTDILAAARYVLTWQSRRRREEEARREYPEIPLVTDPEALPGRGGFDVVVKCVDHEAFRSLDLAPLLNEGCETCSIVKRKEERREE